MRNRTALLTAAPLAVLALAGTALGGAPDPPDRPEPPTRVRLTAEPAAVEVVPMPCIRPGQLRVGMTNTGSTPVFADLDLSAAAPITLSRRLFSSYLPATDPDQAVTAPVTVRVPPGTPPGDHSVILAHGNDRLEVPVRVLPVPPKGPGDNLLVGEQAEASSTHGNVTLCGGVDGDADSEHWGASGWHDATKGVFPDSYAVNLPAPVTIGRVELQTLDSARYPAAAMGVRDWDLQLRVDGAWVTVNQVRGSTTGRVVSTFAAVRADAVRVVVTDSNDHGYSRIVELEAYDR